MTDRAFYATKAVSAKRRGQMLVLAPLALINVALFVNRLDWAFALLALVCAMLALTQFIAIRRSHVVVITSDAGLRNYGPFGSRFARWDEITDVDIRPEAKVGVVKYTTSVGKMDYHMNIMTGFLSDDDLYALSDLVAHRRSTLNSADTAPATPVPVAPEGVAN